MTHATALPWTRTCDGLPEPAWLNSRRSAPLLFVVRDSRTVVQGHMDLLDTQMPWWDSSSRRAWSLEEVSHWMYEPKAPPRQWVNGVEVDYPHDGVEASAACECGEAGS